MAQRGRLRMGHDRLRVARGRLRIAQCRLQMAKCSRSRLAFVVSGCDQGRW